MALSRRVTMSDLSPPSGANRTSSRHRRRADSDPGCVKTHTSAKCRKHNSPARHPTSRVQYDLTLRDAIAQRYFYVWRERRSFRTAKTQSGHEPFGRNGNDPGRTLMEIKGKTVLVTGASSGVGAAIAKEMALAGAGELLLLARNENELK